MTSGRSSKAIQSPPPHEDDVPEYVRRFEAAASYLPADQLPLLRRAWQVGASAHEGQTRKSGEPYITHPVAVAQVLAELGMDVETLIAAVLHDTIEDTPLTREEIAGAFGEAVAELVDGVTKLDKLKFRDRKEAAAESFRKMLLAMSRDLRVIMIKLADRLHNMRTLGAQSAEARTRIARETLDIYAPIAQRLGMSLVKSELQDLSFAAMYPWRHAIIRKHIQSQPVMRREALAQIETQLTQSLTREGIAHRLVSRVKTAWSIYTKMRSEGKSFDQVMDVFGFRVVVTSVPDVYHALGAAHGQFKPLDGRFRDFIAIPKANGYQSLHTVLFGPYGSPIEVQIRTEEMDLVAERGIAAHWTYKFGTQMPNSAQSRAHAWISELIENQRSAGSSLEFLDNVKVDLFPDEVYLFTPKGKILSLPRNSTALDFAYAVHTDVGNQAVASRVDKKLVPLRTKLTSGQSVEIITAKSAAPKPQWLEFVVTSKARTAIRHQLKQLGHEDAVQLGHRMLDRALEDLDSSLDRLPAQRLESFLVEHKYPRLEALLEDVALGNWMPAQAAQAMMAFADLRSGGHSKHSQEKILITGGERGVISFANCCQPIPGDEIMGFHTAGKGIVVHRLDCPNVVEFRKSPDRWVAIDWDPGVSGDYDASLLIEVENRTGVLAQVAAAVAQSQSNIERVEYLERDINAAVLRFNIQVRDRNHLAEVMRRLRRLQTVLGVRRA
ncbi:bifunctional (p)ppGpp synthetase/guanosine-3',5'-bis(diphosphate) 3'-pyrophosphohydrolase [Pseudoxanthomonas sp. X-1]|uniref:RelA/SpoT family protein n=1 Tax=Pseudoxanthomonas sp. X-1 TaxID=2571115 RepID=UPI00110A65C3|nr:bifunctional (p)ppGpp synthetase/guanosine-3',5'-bis(diphosphate) 3'-pyrophosphohydrolase [Pseudoxanthomonas sp. X-1]TMN16029.1 bifunctional (p)ppGpp synthetase/guanosine-3',5'-bis(diphosphate) 3'-pyrophosphohydrolase [Pseudoxanthomonas sp. X-1]UAY75686.1 bifunctional (p)ppGpp synthetase/guanosine-3',5'-bis(diphosphate) 3'-pyrophosphohydrolase [Pseudoxanthomonas sp. X-1]